MVCAGPRVGLWALMEKGLPPDREGAEEGRHPARLGGGLSADDENVGEP
jgi:hypothetical protein